MSSKTKDWLKFIKIYVIIDQRLAEIYKDICHQRPKTMLSQIKDWLKFIKIYVITDQRLVEIYDSFYLQFYQRSFCINLFNLKDFYFTY